MRKLFEDKPEEPTPPEQGEGSPEPVETGEPVA